MTVPTIRALSLFLATDGLFTWQVPSDVVVQLIVLGQLFEVFSLPLLRNRRTWIVTSTFGRAGDVDTVNRDHQLPSFALRTGLPVSDTVKVGAVVVVVVGGAVVVVVGGAVVVVVAGAVVVVVAGTVVVVVADVVTVVEGTGMARI